MKDAVGLKVILYWFFLVKSPHFLYAPHVRLTLSAVHVVVLCFQLNWI